MPRPAIRTTAGRIVTRRRPGYAEIECPGPEGTTTAPSGQPTPPPSTNVRAACVRRNPHARRIAVSPIPRPTMDDYVSSVPIPDRWRIVDALGYHDRWFDPYNRNILKADKPVHGDWFFNLGVISDTVVEVREVPTPVGISSTHSPGEIDVFGGSDQIAAIQNVALEFVYYEGNTVFRPPDYEFRFTPVFNVNYTRARRNPRRRRRSTRRTHAHRQLRRHSGSLRRQTPAQRIRPLTTSTASASAFSRSRRTFAASCSRTINSACGCSATAQQQRLSVQPRVVPPHREGHQQRPERHRQVAARRRHLRRQPLLAGPAVAGVHVAGSRRLQPQPRRRRQYLRPERLHRAAGVDRRRAPAQLRRRLRRLQRRRSLRAA